MADGENARATSEVLDRRDLVQQKAANRPHALAEALIYSLRIVINLPSVFILISPPLFSKYCGIFLYS